MVFAAMLLFAPLAAAADRTITLASTTSTQNSGLYDAILPAFEADTGIRVNVVAVGTGQALRIAQNGDADVLIVHHRPSEEAFVAAGHGIERRDVMYNDFVIVGPAEDPANLRTAPSLVGAISRIAAAKAPFISRGDESGTHKKEREIWLAAGVEPAGDWYREIGAGMGAALNMASAVDAYVLTDRGTWLSFGNKGRLEILFSGVEDLRNPYGVILVNPERHPHVKITEARVFADWLTSTRGQKLIADFRVGNQQLFCPLVVVADADVICPADTTN